MRVICLLALVALAVTPILAFADDIDAGTLVVVGANLQCLRLKACTQYLVHVRCIRQ
jgi:hypothetical protein